jgi:hypothetical protein
VKKAVRNTCLKRLELRGSKGLVYGCGVLWAALHGSGIA